MKLAAALELAALILEAIDEAERDGKDDVELMERAKRLDGDARAELVAAISEAEQRGD